MNAALLSLLGVALAIIIGGLQIQLNRINDRLDRVIDRLGTMEVRLSQIGQRLDDHIVDHPAPREESMTPVQMTTAQVAERLGISVHTVRQAPRPRHHATP